MAIRIQPLDAGTWPALEALFREGGDPRWCWCQFWRLRSTEFGAAKVPQLRQRLRALAGSERPPGLVALEEEGAGEDNAGEDNADGNGGGVRAIGWVSLGPRTEYERIVRSKVIPKIDDRPVWSIVCFAVSATARGRGVARALLDGAIDYARTSGAEALEAYPLILDGDAAVEAEAAFTGTVPMFERAGFHVVAERASDPSSSRQRVVVRRELG